MNTHAAVIAELIDRPIPETTAPADWTDVEAALDAVRPAMEADGGGVTLVRVENGRVDIRLRGMCLDCPSAPLTLKWGIERTLKARLPWVVSVRRVD